MRMIMMVLGLTLSALVMVWKMDQGGRLQAALEGGEAGVLGDVIAEVEALFDATGLSGASPSGLLHILPEEFTANMPDPEKIMAELSGELSAETGNTASSLRPIPKERAMSSGGGARFISTAPAD